MNPEKAQALIDIYAALFSALDERSCMSLFGFECGDGWYELLRELIQGIKKVCEEKDLCIQVNQVKEKYGTLRFYLSAETDEISRLIEKAEGASARTCENCGEPGAMREESLWYSVRCDECWNRILSTYPNTCVNNNLNDIKT